jgi:hypothetical protein
MAGNYLAQTGKWSEADALFAPVFARAFDESETGSAHVCAQHAPGAGGEVRWPMVIDARLWANAVRAEAGVRTGDVAVVEKRIADIKALRAQMAPWKSMISPHFNALWDAMEAHLLARAHAGSKPAPEAEKKVIAALEKLESLQGEGDTSGPAFDLTAHELLAERLLADGKAKEALAKYEKDLDERPNRAIALLGAARAAKASGDAAKAHDYYARLADQWKDADADAPAIAEVRDGAR